MALASVTPTKILRCTLELTAHGPVNKTVPTPMVFANGVGTQEAGGCKVYANVGLVGLERCASLGARQCVQRIAMTTETASLAKMDPVSAASVALVARVRHVIFAT